MKKLTVTEIREESIKLLEDVHNFCVQNNLKYSLFYGTLIGAIRHKGFIPWDDDIDIVMPRNDYEYLINNFKSKNTFIMSAYNDKRYFLPYAKACNKIIFEHIDLPVYKDNDLNFGIDIYPFDYIENKETFLGLRKKEWKLIRKYNLTHSNLKAGTIFSRLAKFFLIPLYKGQQNKYAIKIDEYFLRNCEPNFFIENTVYFHRNCIFDKDIFDKFILASFEGKQFFCTSKFDECLTLLYGNYMQLPKESERVSTHLSVPYYKDEENN